MLHIASLLALGVVLLGTSGSLRGGVVHRLEETPGELRLRAWSQVDRDAVCRLTLQLQSRSVRDAPVKIDVKLVVPRSADGLVVWRVVGDAGMYRVIAGPSLECATP